MTRRCPCCGLPAHDFGRIASASSNDGRVHGLIAICRRCAAAEAGLPKSIRWKRINRALDRALAEPEKFMVKIYPDPGAAQLAQAMLMHPAHGQVMLAGLGWAE